MQRGTTSMPYQKLYDNGCFENPIGIYGDHDVNKANRIILVHTCTMMMMMMMMTMYCSFSVPTASIFRIGK
jgi:hypothetical protein